MNALRKLCRSSVIPSRVIPTLFSHQFISQNRFLFSASSLGLDKYVVIREKTLAQFSSTEDKFKAKMAEFSDPQSKHMIFTEDLKSMVHLVQDREDDLTVFRQMLVKFNDQNKELRFGSFIFGPVIMRMYYYLEKPMEALDAFKDEKLAGIFDQLISYQLLMDLLFKTENYDKVLEVFEIIKNKQLQPNRYPKNIVVLFFAACYKINTPESFQLATDTWQELSKTGHNPTRRTVTYFSALALNQGYPHVALEVISTEYNQAYVTVRNLKARALADLGRMEDVLPLMRSTLNVDDPTRRKTGFTEDTMLHLRAAIKNCSDKEIVAEFDRFDKQLETHGFIGPETVDSILMQDIVSTPLNPGQKTDLLSGSYNRQAYRPEFRQRQGLADMY